MPTSKVVEPQINAADVLVGKEALERVKAEVDKVDVTGLHVPRSERRVMVQLILARLVTLEGEVAGIVEELSAARGKRLKAAMKRLPDLCRAILYAQTRYQSALASADDAAQERLIETVRRWRKPSFILLTQLVDLGYVDAKIAAHIRSGRGDADAAQDAVEMTTLFDEHKAAVELLQSIQSDPAKRITATDIAAQQEAAIKFMEAREAQDAHLPAEARRKEWARTVTALQALIDEDWDEVRLDAEFAFKHQRRPAEVFVDLVSTNALVLRREP
jgi:DNA polymerase III gamma/tau subunit